MYRRLCFLGFFCILLFFKINACLANIPSEHYFTSEGTPSSIVDGCVNTITGEYFYEAPVMSVPGNCGLDFKMHYSSRYKETRLAYGWRPSHMNILFMYTHKPRPIRDKGTPKPKWSRAISEEPSGSVVFHTARDPVEKDYYAINMSVHGRGFTNLTGSEISARTSLKNNLVLRDKKGYYVSRGDGSRSYYKKIEAADKTPDWLLQIVEDRLSNGNVVKHSYGEMRRPLKIQGHNRREEKIPCFAEQRLNDIHYKVQGSNGKWIHYRLSKAKANGRQKLITRISSSDHEDVVLKYCRSDQWNYDKKIGRAHV